MLTSLGKRAQEDHFDPNYELEQQIAGTDKESLLTDIRQLIDECTFSYTRQREMKGLGHAILSGESLIGEQPFGVVLADDLCINPDGPGVLAQMAQLYKQFRCSIVAVMEVPENEVHHKYGIIAGLAWFVRAESGHNLTIKTTTKKRLANIPTLYVNDLHNAVLYIHKSTAIERIKPEYRVGQMKGDNAYK